VFNRKSQPKADALLARAILPVSVANMSGRQRLEMLAYLNYGFPTFFLETGSVSDEVLHLFDEVSYPVWRYLHRLAQNAPHEVGPGAAGALNVNGRSILPPRRSKLDAEYQKGIELMGKRKPSIL
jgi:hypothetical protein